MARNHKAGGQGEPHAARMGELLPGFVTLSFGLVTEVVSPTALQAITELIEMIAADRVLRDRAAS